jgi:hypothetical protein
MTSRFTVCMKGTNPNAQMYAAAAKNASSVGSKKFVFFPIHDDRLGTSFGSKGRTDNPILNSWWCQKYRWIWHDFRMFGLFGTLRKQYYFGEAFRIKCERIFAGKDEEGNKYWFTRRAACQTRMVEPVDPHWFRGADAGGQHPAWQKWLFQHTAHSPAVMRARGERSMMTHWVDTNTFLNVKWHRHSQFFHAATTRDPGMFHNASLLNPDYKIMEEAGFSRWFQLQTNVGGPVHPPFFGEHDFSDDLVEEYYRGQWAFCRSNKGTDHDEWRG